MTARLVLRARKEAGLTQKEAGELIGCSRRTWQDWEAGARKMRKTYFEIFVEMTGIAT
jgi:DNA-binding XRE family transcriptional regulator